MAQDGAQIFATPLLARDDERLLDALETLHDRTSQHLARRRRWSGTLARHARARALRASNSIEQITVSLEEALAIDSRSDIEQRMTDDWLAVQGYAHAMTFARILGEDSSRALDLSTLLAMHFMVQNHHLAMSPGQLRRGDIHVVDSATRRTTYTGPNAEVLPALLEAMLDGLRPRPDGFRPAVISGAMAHLNLVMIHPFRDGNGRMARILQSLELYRGQVHEAEFVSVEEYLGRNAADYYDVLARVGGGRWEPESDARPWIEFMLTAHYRQARSVQKRLWRADRIAEIVDDLVGAGDAPQRATPALEQVFHGWMLRNEIYRELVGVSANVASRELRVLVDAALLTQVGHKRGTTYAPGPRVEAELALIHQEAERRFPIGIDPYRALARGDDLVDP